MTLSRACIMLWSTSMFFVLLPQLSCGLLSDFKICGDSECESLMSRVRAVRDHHGKDCRFLSFQQGETISVYHKLTGKRSNLWAGSMHKQFGYFPKEAVKEEQKFATKEIVVATQESDFLCMDHFGYPIDSSHLNTDDDEEEEQEEEKDDSGLKSPPQGIEMSQISSYTDNTNAGTPPSKDSSSESHSTSRKDIENRDIGAAETKQESFESAVELKEKGGSPASSWLSSSVAGWLGAGKHEGPENSAEEEDSLMSSVTGWMGLKSERKSISTEENGERQEREQDSKDVETSSTTGWLGFEGHEKSDSSAGKEIDDERELDIKTAQGENFRSRKMHLDLETQLIQEKKLNDMGTLSWLGNGLSRTLGFALNDQDTSETLQVSRGEVEKDVQETTSSSWFDLGISSILAFKKDNSEGERTKSDTESDNIVQGSVDSDNTEDTSADMKASELDDISQVDQNDNPLQKQRSDIYLVPNGKEEKSKFDILASTNDIPSKPIRTYMESRSMDQLVSEIEDSQNDSNDKASLHEFTNQIETLGDKLNMSCICGSSDEGCKCEKKDKDFAMLDESAAQSQGEDTGSPLASKTEINESEKDDKQEEVHNKEKGEDIDEQEKVEYNHEVMDCVAEKEKLQDKSLEKIEERATRENWNITEDNTQEDDDHQELVSNHLIKSDPGMIHENLSNEDKGKYSSPGSTSSQDAKDMEPLYLKETFTLVTFFKESSLVSSEKERNEDEKHEELGGEEKYDEIKKIEEQEDRQALKDITVTQKQQEELTSKQKPDILLEEKVEEFEDEKQKRFEREDQVEMEMLDKNHEVDNHSVKKIEEKKLFEELNYLKYGIFEEQDKPKYMKEIDHKKHGELKDFIQEEIEDFEEENHEGYEREKSEVVDVLFEKMQEVVKELKQEKVDQFKDRQKQHQAKTLKDKNYNVNVESGEELEDKQEELEDWEQEVVVKLEGKKRQVDAESVEVLEDKRQELEHKEDRFQQKHGMDGESVERFKNKQQKEFKDKEKDMERLENHEKGQTGDKLQEVRMKDKNIKKQEEMNKLVGGTNEFEDDKQEYLNIIIKQEEFGENGKEGVTKWKVVDDLEKETQEALIQVKKEKGQEFNASDFVDSKNDQEENETVGCRDELCTRVEQNEIMRAREENSFEDGSNPNTRTEENTKVSVKNIEQDLIGSTFDQADKTQLTENVPYLDENDRAANTIFQSIYSVGTESNGKNIICNGMNAGCQKESKNDVKKTEMDPFVEKSEVTTESVGVFSLFQKVISLAQMPIMKENEVTESLDGKINAMSKAQPLQSPEHELDSTTNSNKDLQTNFQPPSPSLIQNSHINSMPSNTAKTQQLNLLSKHYRTLQDHMSTEEITILVELFGKEKLKHLYYTLGHADAFTDDSRDESVLLDLETILHIHKEKLFTPTMRLSDAPEEDKEKTRTIIAIQKLEILLKSARDTFNTRKSDINKANPQAAQLSGLGTSCSAYTTDQKSLETMRVMMDKHKNEGPEEKMEDDNERGSEEMPLGEKVNKLSRRQSVPQLLEGTMEQIHDVIHQIQEQSSAQTHALRDFVKWLKMKVVSSLPYDFRPVPDLYGIPWEFIIISSLLGLVTMLLFSCRCYNSVKSRLYRRKEWWMAEQVAQLLEEKCEVLETLSKCQQEYDELENSLSECGTVVQTHSTDLEVRTQQLDIAKTQLEENLQELKDQLDQQRAHRIEQEQKLTLLEQNLETIEEETKELQSQEEQAQTTIKVYNMNSERLQRNLETAAEENSLLKESNTQLKQQVEGWAERVSELEEEMRRYELAHSGMVQDVANKDERIMSLTDRLLGMKAWDAELEAEGADTSKGTTGRAERNGKLDETNSEVHLQKVQQLIYAAKLNADLKSVDEDKDRVFAKLNDEVKAKEDLEVSIKDLENERLSMQAETEHYSEQVQRLQQKLQIMTEMYQENELKLHRLLTVEEKERLQKEDKLNKADKNIALAMEELNNYRLRAGEMEEELEKTKQSYQTQISAHEKKAHNNWLAARAAERELSDIKRENALLRQKLTDTQFKLDALDKDPFALDSLARPLPFRAERLPYGPSPLGRPASENRALLSSPTLLERPLPRLSPRGTCGPVEPPSGQGELEQSGGAHSDSGSISPSWERDRRGPPGPFPSQGYMIPEPGGPIYRRPGPPPGVMGPLPPFPHPRGLPNSGPLGPIHPADSTDSRENILGPEHDHREPGPGDRRTPPEPTLRMGPAPPPGPPMGPVDSAFPRRAPFGPPDFFPPRGPGGPPMMPMWAPRPGMMFPPRYPPGGPLPPHTLSYPMRPLPPDGLLPPSMGPPTSQQNPPSVPRSQSQDEQTATP